MVQIEVNDNSVGFSGYGNGAHILDKKPRLFLEMSYCEVTIDVDDAEYYTASEMKEFSFKFIFLYR